MRHLTQWHPEHKVPIVDGRFQDPNTGEIQQNTRTDTYLGPPSVHVMWFNVHDSSSFRGLGATFNASINEVFITIADHVRDGVYSIISLNASLYAVTVVCETDKAREEVGGVIQGFLYRQFLVYPCMAPSTTSLDGKAGLVTGSNTEASAPMAKHPFRDSSKLNQWLCSLNLN
ncbi:hypothetical protein CNMCM7691_003835 [Aspergillus felis]|uniref:Uncharacterized protein n=1 Tax=Aspergillus felis TaxID=1287682 RepID=A0A8H6R0B9_9EURO|nr:hypothetical protein CNMCM7691_003835 [Aspergillus felis]